MCQPTLRHLALSTLRHLIEKDPVSNYFLFSTSFFGYMFPLLMENAYMDVNYPYMAVKYEV